MICKKKSFAKPGASTLVVVGIKVTNLLKRSTTVKIASNPDVVVGREVIRSILTLSKALKGGRKA